MLGRGRLELTDPVKIIFLVGIVRIHDCNKPKGRRTRENVFRVFRESQFLAVIYYYIATVIFVKLDLRAPLDLYFVQIRVLHNCELVKKVARHEGYYTLVESKFLVGFEYECSADSHHGLR